MNNLMKNICTDYISLIKQSIGYDNNILNKIMIKYNFEFNFNCMMSLSNYYNFLQEKFDDNDRFMLRLKERYGIDNEYWQRQQQLWEAI